MLSPISRVRTVVSRTALALFATLAMASATNAQETPEVTATLATSAEPTTVQVLVEFFGEPAALSYGRAFDRDKPRGTSAATTSAVNAGRAQISANRSEQSRVIAEIAKTGVNKIELYRATRAVNGVAYQVQRADIDRLRKVVGVKSVKIIDPEFLHMSTTIPFLGVPAVWSGASPLGVTGQGVRIGIIDTGVDYQHAMFVVRGLA
jgi:subtilisin family serine protease